MTSSAHRLVLWDIDQTLIDLRGAGRGWYRQVLEEVTGVAMTQMPDFFGRTERAITAEVLTRHGIEPTEELIRKMWAALTAVSELALPELAKRGLALPGAATALAGVAEAGAVQSLVTGNLREVAWHKLSAFGLHTHLDFEIGGYGDLSAYRPDLVAYAVDRAHAALGRPFEPASVIVVGDTPHDIDAARAHGAVAVGVATGRFDSEALREAGAQVVLRDLSDTKLVLSAVFG
ncbi:MULTISPECIES: HAD family hydrolase [Amycolatopsis]|uniref:HAD family hydrolase n=1 Tax=Amycolatopsis TaxID=1813 RepID=UPI000B8B8477|nr:MULTISPECIES: haloacid dehalogenase-like hydrolase [Amycolatopsis]OXM73647.1 haloacid dehalogenase [Amycolatopsis sp. KNN50.9b]